MWYGNGSLCDFSWSSTMFTVLKYLLFVVKMASLFVLTWNSWELEAHINGLSHATWMRPSWVLQTKESCSATPPAGAQRADRHTAVQTGGGDVGADGRCFWGGRGGRAVRRTRMLNLFKALCVYIWSVSWLIFSWCFYEDESILKQIVTHETCSLLLSLAVMGNVGGEASWEM